jgi:hypothetical protein
MKCDVTVHMVVLNLRHEDYGRVDIHVQIHVFLTPAASPRPASESSAPDGQKAG